MNRLLFQVALLLFGSGFCALVYQVAWLRLLRLVFGGTTAASAAVLAIFMGGLGLGSRFFGRRADANPRPLGLYALLEFGVAVTAALTPLLVIAVRHAYAGLGGSLHLGLVLGSIVRVLLAMLVLGGTTFLMGGTLPAAVRAVETRTDVGRRNTGVLYGANTLGAVAGAVWATFFSLEQLGDRLTIWTACLINALVFVIARGIARNLAPTTVEDTAPDAEEAGPAPSLRPRLILGAAFVTGFSFLLLELVWYRMLTPLLGGTTYSFGLILALALAGIGIGGALYGRGERERRPQVVGFALTCTLEALCIIIPFALGDRLAMLTAILRHFSDYGFGGTVVAWTAVAAIVVFPAALVSGYQFPLLIGLLGSGEQRVGRQVGQAYLWNTLGAIAGSLAGGFGLLPALSAPRTWQLVALAMVATAVVALLCSRGETAVALRRAVAVAVCGLAVWATTATGPTAVWRHSGVGVSRYTGGEEDEGTGPNVLRSILNAKRRAVLWETDGVETSIALARLFSFGFLVNGLGDGTVRPDAPTFTMLGLLPAIFHPRPRSALVIGLGTGTTAGWLAQVPGMERVEVAELEPAVRRVAKDCRVANYDVLSNPRVHVLTADAREVLMTTRRRYDVIVSQPSAPYRAGVGSLFTREFYEAVNRRLRQGGALAQWVQGYSVDAETVKTIYCTVASVFPSVETWQGRRDDLILVARQQTPQHDLQLLARRVQQEPYRTALQRTWGVTGVEGLYSGYLANDRFARGMTARWKMAANTDDRNVIEFGYARHTSESERAVNEQLRQLSRAAHTDQPADLRGDVDWNLVEELVVVHGVADSSPWPPPQQVDEETSHRNEARLAYLKGDLDGALAHWLQQSQPPTQPMDLMMLAEALANAGHEGAPQIADQLRRYAPTEAELAIGVWRYRRGEIRAAADSLARAFRAARADPWVYSAFLDRSLTLATRLGATQLEVARPLVSAVSQRFAAGLMEERRIRTRILLASALQDEQLLADAFAEVEPWVPWEQPILAARYACYRRLHHPLEKVAQREYDEFLRAAPTSF